MKKILKIVFLVLCVSLIVITFLLRKQISGMYSIRRISEDGLYTMSYKSDYKLDSLLEADLSSVSEFEQWISKNIFFGYPIEADETKFGCTAFLAQTKTGDYLLGRNYDYSMTEPLILYTEPKEGYRSIGVTDLSFIGVDETNPADSLMGRVVSLASPVVTLEGFNEKGLGVAILELETEEIHQDNNQSDLLIYNIPRFVLDTCQNVEEAIEAVSKYDIHSDFGYPYHIFLSDTSGNRKVLEWVEGQMVVVNDVCATNFQLAQGEDFLVGIGQERYEIVQTNLKETNGILEMKDAMKLLDQAKSEWNGKWGTQWSCVFNLNTFTMDICIDMDYSKTYSFSLEDFN